MSLRGRGLMAAVLAVAVVGLVPQGPASAKPLDPWWYGAMGLDKFHREVTGKGVKIAVIDQALNADAPELKGAKVKLRIGMRDAGTGETFPAKSYSRAFYASHGTAMTTLLVGQGKGNAPGGAGIRGIAPDAEVYFYQMDPDPTDEGFEFSYGLFEQAIADKVDIISFSFTGETGLVPVIKKAQEAGIVVVAGAGRKDGIIGQPASLRGVVAVGAVDKNAKAWKHQPQGSGSLTVTAPGVKVASGSMEGSATDAHWVSGTERTGTSDATPLVAGALALVKQKYPTATGNQLIQHLIHTTGQETYGWQPTFGFGIPSIGKMLATDPTGWPDVNPLTNGVDAARTDFPPSVYRDPNAPAPTTPAPSTPAPEPADKPSAAQDSSDSSSSALPWMGGGAVLALAVVGAIVIVVRRRRPRQTTPTAPHGDSEP
jgi:subtilisin family serine protease